jgi:hypothetical protein
MASAHSEAECSSTGSADRCDTTADTAAELPPIQRSDQRPTYYIPRAFFTLKGPGTVKGSYILS